MVLKSQKHPFTQNLFLPPHNELLLKKLDEFQKIQGLILIATPIGNLLDISLRALKILENCDIVYCEDTRHTKKLLSFYSIKKSLYSYHEHSSSKNRERLLEQLKNNMSIVFVSDAGTPLISDPGYRLITMCIEENIAATMIPGPCAPIMALGLSGLPTDQFFFAGFIPPKEGARKRFFYEFKTYPMTLVFFETANRLVKTLTLLDSMLPDRTIIIAKELTKLHETFFRGIPSELLQNSNIHEIKGEIVLLIEGYKDNKHLLSDEDLKKIIAEKLNHYSFKEAILQTYEETSLSKKKIYDLGLQLKNIK